VPVPRLSLALDAARFSSPRITSAGLIVHGYEGIGSRWSLRTDGEFNAQVSFDTGQGFAAPKNGGPSCQWTLRTPLPGGSQFPVLCFSGLPQAAFKLNGSGLDNFTLSFAADVPTLQVKLFPDNPIPELPNPWIPLNTAAGKVSFFLKSDGTLQLHGELESSFTVAGHAFTSGFVTIENRRTIIHGEVGGASATLTLTLNDNGTATAAFEGSLTLIPAFCVADRICLSGADGVSSIGFSAGPGGLCASGVLLTLKGLQPGSGDVQFTLQQLCLNLDGTLPPLTLLPTNLAVGPFKLDALNGLVLSGNPLSRTLEVNTTGRLRVGPVLDADFQLHLGRDGVRLANVSPNQTLLGFSFSRVRCEASVDFGNPGNSRLHFAGQMTTLPPPFNDLLLAGEIQPSGLFSLRRGLPLTSLDAASLFPLANVMPSFEYKPGDYANIVRSHGPSGYWRMEEEFQCIWVPTRFVCNSTLSNSSRLAGGLGQCQPGPNWNGSLPTPPLGHQLGAFETNNNHAIRFDGVDDHVVIAVPSSPSTLFQSTNAIAIELWFKRQTGSPSQPRYLAHQRFRWDLYLLPSGAPSPATRLFFHMNGLLNPQTGQGLPALVSRTTFDDTDWHHLVAGFDGAAQYLYVDGRMESWQATRGTRSALNEDIFLAAENDAGGPRYFFNGFLDEVAVYDRALTPVEILDHHLAAGRGGVRLNGQFNFLGLGIGSPPPSFTGLIGQDGSRALQINSGQPDPLNLASTLGIKFPETRVALFSVPGQIIATLDGSLDWPQLFAGQPKVKGFYTSADGGELNVHASDLGTPRLAGFPDFRFTTFDLTKRGAQSPRANFTGSLTFPLNAGGVPFAGEYDGIEFKLWNPAAAWLNAGPGQFHFNDNALKLVFGAGQNKSFSGSGTYYFPPIPTGAYMGASMAWAASGNAALSLRADTGLVPESLRLGGQSPSPAMPAWLARSNSRKSATNGSSTWRDPSRRSCVIAHVGTT
jgi:hypothetical protein